MPLVPGKPALLFDSVDVGSLPAGCDLFGAYVDGNWPTATYAESKARVAAGAFMVTITVAGSLDAMVCDIEPGNISPAAGASWAKNRLARGHRPTIYCSASWVPIVRQALADQQVALSNVDLWVADWTGQPHLFPGSVATQYSNPPSSGGNYDVSMTDGYWPKYTAGSSPTPTPKPEASSMVPLPMLKLGDFGGNVKSLQRLLVPHDSKLAVDGSFGPSTLQAVENWQRLFSLGVDGIVGPKTWSSLVAFG